MNFEVNYLYFIPSLKSQFKKRKKQFLFFQLLKKQNILLNYVYVKEVPPTTVSKIWIKRLKELGFHIKNTSLDHNTDTFQIMNNEIPKTNIYSWRKLRNTLLNYLNADDFSKPHAFLGIAHIIDILSFLKNPQLFIRYIQVCTFLPNITLYSRYVNFIYFIIKYDKVLFKNLKKYLNRKYQFQLCLESFYLYSLKRKIKLQSSLTDYLMKYNHTHVKNLKYIEYTYILNDKILVSPILSPWKHKKKIYIPKGNWYEFETWEIIKGDFLYNIPINISYYPTFIKEGTILISQNTFHKISLFRLEIYPSDTIKEILYFNRQNIPIQCITISGEKKNNKLFLNFEIDVKNIAQQENLYIEILVPKEYLSLTNKTKNNIKPESISLKNEFRDIQLHCFLLQIQKDIKIVLYS